jgi:hypothetical protein
VDIPGWAIPAADGRAAATQVGVTPEVVTRAEVIPVVVIRAVVTRAVVIRAVAATHITKPSC